jgi:PKD repeat protein
MSGRHPFRLAGAALIASCLVLSPSRLAAQDGPPAALDRDLVDLAANPDAPPVDVWVLFAVQPATAVAEDLRPGYDRLVESARAPALAALARIEPLLPPREERARLGVGGVMELERALLTDDEVAAIRASHAETLRLVQEMRTRIFEQAQPACDAQQLPVVAWIEAVPGARVETRSVVLDAIIARLPPAALPDLVRAFPGVARIARAGRRTVDLNTSTTTIGAANWTSHSYSGGGVKVAVVDTGIDATHPAFTTSSSTAVVTASTVKLSAASSDPAFGDNASSTDDYHGHGTHCGGIVASNDTTYTGVAPGTSLMNAKCFFKTTSGGGSAYDSDIVAAIDWAITNGANVLSCSYGGSGTSDGNDLFTIYHDAVVDVSGVAVALAAGNSGSSSGTILLPGDGMNVLTVGAFNDNHTTTLSDDSLASFSSRGPTADGRRKPDLCAPGYQINSCNAFWEGSNPDFVAMSGTSMATPHVAGSMSLLLSYNSAWQPEALKALLANSCRNSSPVTGTPDSNWGCGALDLGQAYTDRTRAFTATLTSSGPVAHYYKLGSLASSGRSTIAWNRAATYSGSTPASGPGSASTLVNLDLYLYDGATGQQSAASASTVDSLEQVAPSSSITDAVLKVYRAGSFPSGKTSQRYGLASVDNATLVNPPDLVITSTSAPSDLAGNTTFTFTATAKNQGDLRAPSPTVTLTLPSGFTFNGSNATQTLSSLDPYATGGGTATASWSVRTGNTSGSFNLSATASTTGFGSTFASPASTRSITVDASPPVANAGPDISVFATSAAGRTVTLDGSASTDNNAAKGLTYEWDTDGDGLFNDTPGSATGVTPSVAFAIGTQAVTLRVTDYVGNTGTDTVVVQVKDNPPVANAGPDRTSNEGSTVAFDGTASTDVEGPIASYAWTFGDGGSATGSKPSHLYRNNGVYTVTLTVTDSAGQTASDTAVQTVLNVPPTANAGTARSGFEGSAVTFAGSATDPGPDDVLTYSWNFGDGGTGTGPTPSHVYVQNGTYTATLTVSDGDGGVGTSTVQAIIANVAPTANAGTARTGDEGSSISFSGSATDPGILDVLTYSWNFGDGGSGTGASPSHVYVQDGVYTATLSVSDGDGGVGTSTVQVTVRNVPPVAFAGPDASSDEGSSVDFAGSGTDAGVLDVLTYSWEFGDGGKSASAVTSHVYEQDGVYTATLTVTDDAGTSSTSTRVITVANVPPDLALPASLQVDVGASLALHLAPTDPSPVDAAALAVTWKLLDSANATLASGTGLDVAWPADRKLGGTLVVDVADDHVTIERTAPFAAVTPPLDDTFGAVIEQGLDPATERRALLGVLAARGPASHAAKLKAAARKLRAVTALLAKHGVTSGPLAARLAVLASDCAAGIAPPADEPFDVPAAPGGIDDLVDAAPRAGFAGKPTSHLVAALANVLYAERLGAAKRTAAAKKHAASVAAALPPGAVGDWFRASVAAL